MKYDSFALPACYCWACPCPTASTWRLICTNGSLLPGETEIPFEIPLKPKPGQTCYETYHGVFVNIQYVMKVEMKRGAFSKDVNKSIEFIVEATRQVEAGKEVRGGPCFWACQCVGRSEECHFSATSPRRGFMHASCLLSSPVQRRLPQRPRIEKFDIALQWVSWGFTSSLCFWSAVIGSCLCC